MCNVYVNRLENQLSAPSILSSPENHPLTTTTTPGTDQPAQAEVSPTHTDLVSAAGSGTVGQMSVFNQCASRVIKTIVQILHLCHAMSSMMSFHCLDVKAKPPERE